jgi:hypothetical protein
MNQKGIHEVINFNMYLLCVRPGWLEKTINPFLPGRKKKIRQIFEKMALPRLPPPPSIGYLAEGSFTIVAQP